MPVTAKLSKAFYQKLGHEVTDELVDYLNRRSGTLAFD